MTEQSQAAATSVDRAVGGVQTGRGHLPRLRASARTITVAAAILGAVLLLLVGAPLYDGMKRLRGAPHDNLQWAFAQLEVDLLRMAQSARAAADGRLPVGDVRRRFDVFYSRVDLLRQGSAYAGLRDVPEVGAALDRLAAFLDRSVATIDAPDATLAARLPEFAVEAAALYPSVRALSLEGVRIFSHRSDGERGAFEDLLLRASLVALGLILVLGMTLAVLVRQQGLSQRRAGALARTGQRLEETIDASLDAIIVSNAAGRIIGFNKAAEQIFGIPQAEALGASLASTIIPEQHRAAHAAGMARYLATGEKRVIQGGRFELSALRADGSEFPVELAVGTATDENGPIFIAYIRDISARRAAEQELRAARDKAMEADRAKSEFIAVMSHEMRTPLNGLLGALDLLQEAGLDDMQRRYLGVAHRSGEILLRRINDVLDISRISSDAIGFEAKPMDVVALASQVLELSRPLAETRGLQLSFASEVPGLFVSGDPDRLHQVLMNLLDNAIKFTRSGSIEVTLAELGREADQASFELSVRDTGAGIAGADLDRVFDDFVTLDPSYHREVSGSGLGLAICRRLIEGMGGRIGAESVVGEGSRFWARLALPRVPASSARTLQPASTDLPERGTFSGRRVLVVEDNEINRFVLREMLEKMGVIVDEAADGRQGVDLALAGNYDLILMDISMPVVDGVEAAQQIRAASGMPRSAPIIGVTAHALPEERGRFAQAGMNRLLVKPVRADALERLLGDLGWNNSSTAAPAPDRKTVQRDTSDEEHRTVRPLVDQSVLEELAVQVSPHRLPALLDRAITEFEGVHAEISAAISAGDLERGTMCAHRVAGTAALVGANRLHHALAAVEQSCKRSNLSEAERECRNVADVARATARSFRSH